MAGRKRILVKKNFTLKIGWDQKSSRTAKSKAGEQVVIISQRFNTGFTLVVFPFIMSTNNIVISSPFRSP